MNIVILTMSLVVLNTSVRTFDMRPVSLFHQNYIADKSSRAANLPAVISPTLQKQCYVDNVLTKCPLLPNDLLSNVEINAHYIQKHFQARRTLNDKPTLHFNIFPSHSTLAKYGLPRNSGELFLGSLLSKNTNLNLKLDNPLKNFNSKPVVKTTDLWPHPPTTTSSQGLEVISEFNRPNLSVQNSVQEKSVLEKFTHSLDNFERKFYEVTFSKLTSISPASRHENGMSYVQSGLFLQLTLMALAMEVDKDAKREIDQCLDLYVSDKEQIQIINETLITLPVSSDSLKFRWSSRLVLRAQHRVSQKFRNVTAPALQLRIDNFNGTETPSEMVEGLNKMVDVDSGGAIHDTFEAADFSEGVRDILITTLYLRARWRSAPTLLNGTHRFYYSANGPHGTLRMIRVNDIMRYAHLPEWNAEALEIFYSTPGLSLLMLVPRGKSLRHLIDQAVNTSLITIMQKMQTLRVAATLPLYTLRMTLLLPNKLEAMGITKLVNTENGSQSERLQLSHAVQRIMFWAEAGRNAFKDDSLEWDESPERELVVDCPYIFYVRWKNKTLMNGNFVL